MLVFDTGSIPDFETHHNKIKILMLEKIKKRFVITSSATADVSRNLVNCFSCHARLKNTLKIADIYKISTLPSVIRYTTHSVLVLLFSFSYVKPLM